jgi:hypothetical protein
MVTLWYPAEATNGAPAPYVDNLDKLARVIDPALLKIARSVRPYASAGAKISSAESRFPVLIFSPGNEANVATYAALIEELSSHGYLALGICHPYEAVAVLYPDGRIARFNSEDNRPKQGTPNLPEVFGRFYRERVDWRAGDASFALTQLEKLNAGNPASQFNNRLDLSRVGGIGHSIGAVAAAQMCQTDRRFKACLNLDGKAASRSLYPNSEGKGPDQPFMSIEKPLPDPTEKQLADWRTTREQVEQHRKELREREAELLKTVKGGSYSVLLRGASHQSFSDQLLILSFHLHSRYVRLLADLPWFGIAVRVEIQAQRLYCRHVECPQRIFVSLGPCNDSPEIHQARFRQRELAICSQSPVAGGQVPGAVPAVMGMTVWGRLLNCRLIHDAWRISGESLHGPKKYKRSGKRPFSLLLYFLPSLWRRSLFGNAGRILLLFPFLLRIFLFLVFLFRLAVFSFGGRRLVGARRLISLPSCLFGGGG